MRFIVFALAESAGSIGCYPLNVSKSKKLQKTENIFDPPRGHAPGDASV
jgi:hypothetical protein